MSEQTYSLEREGRWGLTCRQCGETIEVHTPDDDHTLGDCDAAITHDAGGASGGFCEKTITCKKCGNVLYVESRDW